MLIEKLNSILLKMLNSQRFIRGLARIRRVNNKFRSVVRYTEEGERHGIGYTK